MSNSKAKHRSGDLVVWNQSGNFGNEEDKLFHIHSVRYGTCAGFPGKRHWYSGYLLKIENYESEGLPQVPVFETTITNAPEERLRELEHLVLG
tara:strand:+ start:870 stop:1148 length:279 start_codon:yes stop_codon:yes gene_type:complete